MINELMERNISSVHDLEMEINKVEGKLEKVAGKVRRQSSDIKELTNLLRLNDYYKTYRPLYLEMNKIWFKSRKENFRKEHEAEMNKYYVAENKLKAYRKDGKLPIAQWKKQLEEAKEIRAEDISQRDEIRQELEMLQQIYDALDQGLAILKTEGGAYGGRNSVERTEAERDGDGKIRGSRTEEDFLTKGNQFDRSTESNQRRNSGREKQSVLEQLHEKQAQKQPKLKKKRSHDMSL